MEGAWCKTKVLPCALKAGYQHSVLSAFDVTKLRLHLLHSAFSFEAGSVCDAGQTGQQYSTQASGALETQQDSSVLAKEPGSTVDRQELSGHLSHEGISHFDNDPSLLDHDAAASKPSLGHDSMNSLQASLPVGVSMTHASAQ